MPHYHDWLYCRGWWPRLVAWACRRQLPAAKRYAASRLAQALDDEAMQAVLSACIRTGHPVVAQRDDDLTLHVHVRDVTNQEIPETQDKIDRVLRDL